MTIRLAREQLQTMIDMLDGKVVEDFFDERVRPRDYRPRHDGDGEPQEGEDE